MALTLQRNTVLLHRRKNIVRIARVADFRIVNVSACRCRAAGLAGIVIVPIACRRSHDALLQATRSTASRCRAPGQIIVRQKQLHRIDARHKGAVIAFFKGNSAVQFRAVVVQHQRAGTARRRSAVPFLRRPRGADGVEPGRASSSSSPVSIKPMRVPVVNAVVEDPVSSVRMVLSALSAGGFHRLGVFVQSPLCSEHSRSARRASQLNRSPLRAKPGWPAGAAKLMSLQPHGQTGRGGGGGHPFHGEPAVPGGLFAAAARRRCPARG